MLDGAGAFILDQGFGVQNEAPGYIIPKIEIPDKDPPVPPFLTIFPW